MTATLYDAIETHSHFGAGLEVRFALRDKLAYAEKRADSGEGEASTITKAVHWRQVVETLQRLLDDPSTPAMPVTEAQWQAKPTTDGSIWPPVKTPHYANIKFQKWSQVHL